MAPCPNIHLEKRAFARVGLVSFRSTSSEKVLRYLTRYLSTIGIGSGSQVEAIFVCTYLSTSHLLYQLGKVDIDMGFCDPLYLSTLGCRGI